MPLNHDSAYKIALQFTRKRDRSTKEMMDYLSKKGCELSILYTVISDLQKNCILDDHKFSKNRIYSRLHSKNWGIFRIRAELQVSGIPPEVIDEEISKINEQDWEDACKKLSQKYIRIRKDSIKMIKLKEYLESYGHKDYLITKVLKDSGIEFSEE